MHLVKLVTMYVGAQTTNKGRLKNLSNRINGVERMELSDTQTLRILRSPDGPEATTSQEMAQGLDALAHKFKELAQDLRAGKIFICPSCGGSAFCGTDRDGDVHVDMEVHFKQTIPEKIAGPN